MSRPISGSVVPLQVFSSLLQLYTIHLQFYTVPIGVDDQSIYMITIIFLHTGVLNVLYDTTPSGVVILV